MKNIVEKIKKMFDGYVIRRFTHLMPAKLITSLYREIASGDLKLDIREVSVKKGRVKYALLICKDRELKTKFNLGRNGNENFNK